MNTVHHTQILQSIKNGLVLEIRKDSPSYLADRAKAKDSVTGKVIFNDNIEWVKSQIKKYGMYIVSVVNIEKGKSI